MEKSALISIGYGAADSSYMRDGKIFDTPAGTAHFLEHKMFGDDYFERFSRLGASVNAYTGLGITAYYFSTSENFYECLALLLEMVQSPCFSIENVDKEKDIIRREIEMYADDPRWILYLNLMDLLFHKYPVKGNIAGTLDSISLITPDLLYQCHKDFYVASNMNLVCAGNLTADHVFEIAEKLFPGTCENNPARDYGQEPFHAVNSRAIAKTPLSGTLFSLGFKDASFSQNADTAKKIAVTKTLLDYIFGESSKLNQHLYDLGLIDRPFESDFICGSFFGTAIISSGSINSKASAHDIDSIVLAILKELDDIGSNYFSVDRFNHIVKKHIGRMARGFNNISAIVMSEADLRSSNTSLFELADGYTGLCPDYFLTRLNSFFTRDNSALSLVEPLD